MNYQRYFRPALLALGVVVVLAAVGVPVASFLPFLFLLACPLMMVFMMRGMDHSGGGGGCHGSHDHAEHGTHGGQVEQYGQEDPATQPREPR